jgi:hypothetical protein
MTDIVITPASVIAGADASIDFGVAGQTITAGQVVYLETATNMLKLADNNNADIEVRTARGIALNGAAAGQPIAVCRSGQVTIGGTLLPNVAYYLSDTPGGICEVADLAGGEYPTLLGMAKSATSLDVHIYTTGGSL